MNEKLAQDALIALKAKGFEKTNGYCARFARQVCAFSYGDDRWNNLWRPDASPTAAEAGRAFQKSGFGVNLNDVEIGDILFKTVGSNGAGHVGIVTSRGVCENSSVHWNKSGGKDARGLRSLREWGAFQIAIRLPELKHARRDAPVVKAATVPANHGYLLNKKPLPGAREIDGRLMAPIREITTALGWDLDAEDLHALRAWPKGSGV